MPYEDLLVMRPLVEALQKSMLPGDRLIYRAPFRWKEVGEEAEMLHAPVLSNQYEMFDVDSVARSMGCEVIWDFNHAAIVRPADQTKPTA